MFESDLANDDRGTLVENSQTKIVITSIKKNSDSCRKPGKQAFTAHQQQQNLPQQVNSDSSDLELNEARLNTSETISLTNEANIALKNSQRGQFNYNFI